MSEIFGGLVDLNSKNNIEEFIGTIDEKNVGEIVAIIFEYGQRSGIFSFEESAVAYRCLQILRKTSE